MGTYYATRHWRRLRARALMRDGGTCRRCGADANHVDHVIPRSAGGPNVLSNVQSLCQSCHLAKTRNELAAGLGLLAHGGSRSGKDRGVPRLSGKPTAPTRGRIDRVGSFLEPTGGPFLIRGGGSDD